MNSIDEVKKPSKEEQQIALESYNALDAVLKQISSQNAEIEIDETGERIKNSFRRCPFPIIKTVVTVRWDHFLLHRKLETTYLHLR